MDEIEIEFSSVSVKHLEMQMYHPKDALKLINRCRDLNKKILGIDAFIVNGEKIQPSQEDSIDFSVIKSNKGFWDEAVEYIKQYINSEFVFEIVYK